MQTSRAASPTGRGAALVALASAAVLGVGLVRVDDGFVGSPILLALLVGAVTLAPLAVRWWQGRFDVFEPLTIVCATYFLYLSLAPLVHLLTGDVFFLQRSFEDLYVPTLLAVLVPVSATWCGYALPFGRRLVRRRADDALPIEPQAVARLRRWGWLITAAAIVGLLLWARLARISYARFFLPGILSSTDGSGDPTGPGIDIPYFLLTLDFFVPAFLLLVVSGGLRSRILRWAYWAIVAAVYVSMGFRYRLVIFVIAGTTLSFLKRERRPSVWMVASGASLLFLLAGWVSLMRAFFGSGGRATDTDISIGSTLRAALADSRIFEVFGAVLYAIPRFFDYVYLKPFLYPLILPIPRALWKTKPDPDWLATIGPMVGTSIASDAGAAFPHFGEYYLAFGWPGMILGGIAFGIGVRMLWEWFLVNRADPARQVVFAISNIFLLQVIIRGYVSQIVMEWCFLVLPAVLAMGAARRAGRRARVSVGRV